MKFDFGNDIFLIKTFNEPDRVYWLSGFESQIERNKSYDGKKDL